MANTFKKIQTVTVGSGGSSTIEFTSIPQTYTDLKIVVSARSTGSSGANISMRFNSNSTGYTGRRIVGNGATVFSDTTSGTAAASGSAILCGPFSDGSNTANVFGSQEIYIPNYTSSNNKSVSIDAVNENNAATAYQEILAGLWSNTAAITSISLICYQTGNTFAQYTTATLYGVSNVTAASNAYATGGNQIYTDNTYWYHVFTSSGTFTPTKSLTADYLVIAGGGGGGCLNGGGGGAGGLRSTVTATGGGGSLESQLAVTAQAYTVTIGAGGAGSTAASAKGTSGSNSVFSTITSTGGGGGASDANGNGLTGGSGGGASNLGTIGAGTANQGYAGGTSTSSGGGGGGGGGAVGTNAAGNSNGGAGGSGVATSISGTSVTRAGGGGGGGRSNGQPGAAGSGGGGVGGSTTIGAAGTANTGGGGGGGGYNNGTGVPGDGSAGGSGIVIVRYAV